MNPLPLPKSPQQHRPQDDDEERASRRISNVRQNDPSLIRDAPTSQGRLGWVCFEERLGHVRLIRLVYLRFVASLASNYSVILCSENAILGGLQEGGIYAVSPGVVRHLPTLVFREDRIAQLVKRSKLFLVNEIELMHEQEEVSVTRVQMRLNAKGTNLIEVVTV